jgi:hypothetical protein
MFDAVIDQVLQAATVSSGDDLLGFQIDADVTMAEDELLEASSVTESGDPRCRLLMSATLSEQAGTLAQVQRVLQRIWNQTAYSHFSAASIDLGAEHAQLRFVTAAPGLKLCVTGRISISGPHYQRLFRKKR